MMKRRIGWAWKIGIGLVCIVVIYKLAFSSRGSESFEVIRAASVTLGDLTVEITAMGEVKPQNRVEIRPPIEGRIEEVLVEEGDTVRRGEVLAWLSSTERAVLMDAARAQGPEAVERWEKAYKPAPLIAPLDGTIIVRAAEPGQTVTKTDPVVVLSDRLIVEALVDETDLSLISEGQKTVISLDAYPDQEVKGEVDHISYESKLVNNVNVYAVDILPERVPAIFRSGMTATVTFIVAAREDVLRVPSAAVSEWPSKIKRPEGAEFALYKKTFSGKLVPIPVRIGKSDNRMTEIIEGVSDGQEIQVIRRKGAKGGVNPFSAFGRRQKKRRNE